MHQYQLATNASSINFISLFKRVFFFTLAIVFTANHNNRNNKSILIYAAHFGVINQNYADAVDFRTLHVGEETIEKLRAFMDVDRDGEVESHEVARIIDDIDADGDHM